MRRGAVYWVGFEPAQRHQRTASSGDQSNDPAIRAQNRVQVVPLTSNVSRVFSWEALVYLDGVAHKALADQIRTAAKERLSNKIGDLSSSDLVTVEPAIRVQLGLR